MPGVTVTPASPLTPALSPLRRERETLLLAPAKFHGFHRLMKPLRLALIAAALAAPAAAQEAAPSTGGRAIGSLFDALGLRKPVPAAPDFVRDSRPERMDYVPLAPAPEKTGKKDAAKLQAAGAALDRAAAENKRRAARVKTPD